MVLTLDQFKNNFGEHPIPPMLVDLLAFQNASSQWYSLCFELDIFPLEIFADHLQDEYASQFFCFGHDGNYSIYALWLYKDMPLEEMPIVYLNSEGEGSKVLASNLTEFLMLLARDEEPIFGEYSEKTDNEIEHSSRNQAFRDWLLEHYQIQASLNPTEIVRNAQKQYPSLLLKEF